MNSNNNNQENVELKQDIAADSRQECSFLEDSREEEEMDTTMRCREEQCIFRDLPDSDFTPLDSSNDTHQRIPLSPAWSQESREDPEMLKPTVDTAPSQVSYLNGSPSNFVTRISDFDMNSGTIQRLNF
eukprot:CAMPEP_0113615810 /NCGR_PEP_ID=MMETSP0017_2-20120614/7903_1 /TAXON_ID=2856 /ORGANISM="Cylindrotheca closterium" /LENGTH=128 /DNA_ID=CAMNT_0000525079 /DNA_START=80 /DNA_END=466 /DNA_ORIENTATION=+ /assembly_acc=CAM_ASM_000147